MGRTIAEIKAYIDSTPPPHLSAPSRRAFTASYTDLKTIAGLVDERGAAEAIALALEYGRSMGYRMGRREAQLARGGEASGND